MGTVLDKGAWEDLVGELINLLFWLFFIAALILLWGCRTTEVVLAAPEEFWVTIEEMLMALWDDIWAIVELIL